MQIVERTARRIIIDGITDREVRSRNFGGEEHKDHDRNFLLYVPEEIAEELKDRGCEVKYVKVQDPNDAAVPYISVTVSYNLRPVNAYIISNGVTTPLDEEHICMLNYVDIHNMALEIEFGKEKQHMNRAKYIPIFTCGYLRQGAQLNAN